MRALLPTLLLLAAPAAPSAEPPLQPAAAPAASSAAPVVPSQALIEKLGQADRLFLAADYRNALFAYLDAVYMQPRYAPARVKLGYAYLALRYPPQAIAQAEAALAADPDSAEARKLLDDARGSPAEGRVASSAPRAPGAASAPTVTAASGGVPAAAPRAYRLAPEPAPVVAAAATAGSAAQHYRAGLALAEGREWAKAIAELSQAIRADPNLAAAYSARGGAHLAVGKHHEAADDYRNALFIDPMMAAPVYGLAECYRALGDRKNAAHMYQRYAQSNAADVREDLRAEAARRAQESSR